MHRETIRTNQTNFNADVQPAVWCSPAASHDIQRQFHIQTCDLARLQSKKAIGVLSEIWRAVPMAVVKQIPKAVADEKKLRDIVAQCGAVDAVRIIYTVVV
eukprot:COSAG02_NODE_1426_length_12664_cov_6.226980_5_plen_101_part_00